MTTMLQVVLPAREAVLLLEDESRISSWIQVAKAGSFVSPRYGKFEITPQMLQEMISNFKATGRAHVDYDHLSTSDIQLPEQGKAAGWFTELQLRSGNQELWGFVEWTPRAVELIKNKEYRYVSPTFVPKAVSKDDGKPIGARLICAAITNMPFLDGMAPLTLAEVSIDERQRRIYDAFSAKFNDGLQPVGHIVEIFENYVICRKFESGKMYRVSYEMSADMTVTFESEPKEVIVAYVDVESKPESKSEGDVSMAENNAVPNPEIVQLRESVTQLNEKVVELMTSLSNEKTARELAEKQLKERDAKGVVDALVNAGKLPPKQRAWAQSYALSDPTGFKTFAEMLEVQVELRKEHGSGDGNDGKKTDAKQPTVEFAEKIEAHQRENKVSYGDAYKAVQLKEPALFDRYRDEMNGVVAVQ